MVGLIEQTLNLTLQEWGFFAIMVALFLKGIVWSFTPLYKTIKAKRLQEIEK